MTSLDHLTAAFESLWETKIHLLRTDDKAPAEIQPKVREVLAEVAATRDKIEAVLIELQALPPPAPAPLPE